MVTANIDMMIDKFTARSEANLQLGKIDPHLEEG